MHPLMHPQRSNKINKSRGCSPQEDKIMEKTMATFHYSSPKQREIAAIRDKYAVCPGMKEKEMSESKA